MGLAILFVPPIHRLPVLELAVSKHYLPYQVSLPLQFAPLKNPLSTFLGLFFGKFYESP